MIIATTNYIPGMEVVEYKGLATGEVVAGINVIKDIGAGIRNLFGGRVQGYEDEIIQARAQVLKELEAVQLRWVLMPLSELELTLIL